ncbi:hypothetical protein AVEN_239720-1 [Araneus ventricosus]|uniref:Uncharacterized protein n=1 Tax=Araneus ventricosus TaxID=182803 RepID=A0A4Y2S0N2_ARAVE|nr:hypothetical protein AVEN_239720-1 [Araneus ventricosus]
MKEDGMQHLEFYSILWSKVLHTPLHYVRIPNKKIMVTLLIYHCRTRISISYKYPLPCQAYCISSIVLVRLPNNPGPLLNDDPLRFKHNRLIEHFWSLSGPWPHRSNGTSTPTPNRFGF